MHVTCHLLLGSNMGNRAAYLMLAFEEIELHIGKVITSSSVYETAAWGNITQEAFLNQVLCVSTALTPHEILQKISLIEKKASRIRGEKFGPRTLDIDILFFDNNVIIEEDLTIPHPQLHKRLFTLIPLQEIDGSFIHPVLNVSINALVASCPDDLHVHKYQP